MTIEAKTKRGMMDLCHNYLFNAAITKVMEKKLSSRFTLP